ncbi:MAG: O-antigen ligase family protein [Clostridia bacterium]|nr:O-antigen ligase family protein [Clostridia bacterium]
MAVLLSGSALLRGCGKVAQKVRTAAKKSLLFGRKPKERQDSASGIAALLNRLHFASALEKALSESRIFNGLYHYWANLLAGSINNLLLLIAPFCFGMTAISVVFGNWGAVILCPIVLGLLIVLLPQECTIKDFLSGTLLSRLITKKFSYPNGTPKRSISIYMMFCGFAGAFMGLKGLLWGIATMLLLAVFPIIFSVPPMWMVYLLFGALPLCGTSICWALSVAIAVLYLFARAFGKEQGRPLDKIDLLLLIFPLFCLVSTLVSFDVADSAKVAFMWLGLFLCVFFIRRLVCTRRRLTSALVSLAIGGAASGCYGLFQYFSGKVDTTWTDTALFEDLTLRVYSTFANPNVFGEFLLLLIPLVVAAAFYTEHKKLRIALLGIDGILLINLALTYSRGCYVGIAVTAIFFLWHFSKKWMVTVLALLIPLGMLLMPQTVVDRLMSIGDMSDGSTSYRMMIYVGTAWMLLDYWIGGVGIGEKAFNTLYPLYAVPGIAAPHSHSLFFQSVVSFGIMGLVYLIGLFTVYQKQTGAARKTATGKDRLLLIAFNTVMWGMIVQSIFDYTWYNYRVFQLFWIVIVLGISAAEIIKNPTNQEVQHD